MTDPPRPDGTDRDGLDEVLVAASAHLDGEGPPAPRDADAWVTAAAALGDRLRDVPPAPAGLADRQVAAALAALRSETAPPAEREAPTAPVVSLSARAERRRRVLLGAVAAAAVVIVGTLGVGALGIGQDDAADTMASRPTAVDDTTSDDALGGGAADGGATAESSDAIGPRDAAFGADAAPVDLGEHPDASTVLVAWSTSATARASADETVTSLSEAPASGGAPTTSSSAPPQAATAAACPPVPVLAVATVDGRAVVVVADGELVAVLDAATCEQLATTGAR